MARGDGDRADDIVTRARHNDGERLDLINAGVGGIERTRYPIEPDLAVNRRFEIASQSFAHSLPTHPGANRTTSNAKGEKPRSERAYNRQFGWLQLQCNSISGAFLQ